jgi:hypothetical protein
MMPRLAEEWWLWWMTVRLMQEFCLLLVPMELPPQL